MFIASIFRAAAFILNSTKFERNYWKMLSICVAIIASQLRMQANSSHVPLSTKILYIQITHRIDARYIESRFSKVINGFPVHWKWISEGIRLEIWSNQSQSQLALAPTLISSCCSRTTSSCSPMAEPYLLSCPSRISYTSSMPWLLNSFSPRFLDFLVLEPISYAALFESFGMPIFRWGGCCYCCCCYCWI